MPIQITCPGCQAKLRAPDTAVGKKTKCPKCQTIVSVPAGGDSAPAPAAPVAKSAAAPAAGKAEQWFLQTPDGSQYGPVPRSELDQWYAEGRVSADCQLLKEGQAQWQWAPQQYPALAKSAAAATAGVTGSASSSFGSSPAGLLGSSLGSTTAGLSPLTPLSPAAKPDDPYGLAPIGATGLSPLGSSLASSPMYSPASSTATLPSFTSGTAPAPYAPMAGPQVAYGAPAAGGYGTYAGSYPRRSGPHPLAIVSGILSILFGVWNVLGGVILIGLGIFALVGGGTVAATAAADDAQAAGILMAILGALGAFVILIGLIPLGYGIAQACTGVGVIRRRQWARVVTFIFCALCFINMCLHVIGMITLSPYSFLAFFADIVFITLQMIAMCLPDVTRDFT